MRGSCRKVHPMEFVLSPAAERHHRGDVMKSHAENDATEFSDGAGSVARKIDSDENALGQGITDAFVLGYETEDC